MSGDLTFRTRGVLYPCPGGNFRSGFSPKIFAEAPASDICFSTNLEEVTVGLSGMMGSGCCASVHDCRAAPHAILCAR